MSKVCPDISLLLSLKSERRKTNKDVWSKKEPEHEDLEKSRLIHPAKNEKLCSGERAKGEVNNDLIKRLWDPINHLSRSLE